MSLKVSEELVFFLPMNTKLYIEGAFYSSKSRRNLFNFKYIRYNGYNIETMQESNVKYLCITSLVYGQIR